MWLKVVKKTCVDWYGSNYAGKVSLKNCFNVLRKKYFTPLAFQKNDCVVFCGELCPKGQYHAFQTNPNQKHHFPHVAWKVKFLLRNLTLLFVFGKNKALLLDATCYCWRWFCLKRPHFSETKRLFNKLFTGSIIFFCKKTTEKIWFFTATIVLWGNEF